MLLILFLLIPEEKNILESFDNSFYLKQLKLSLPVIHVHCQYLCLLEPPYPKLSSYAFVEHYFIVNNIITEAKCQSTLLTVAGPEVYSLACNLVAPDKPGDKLYDDLVALIKKHYSPAPSIIVQRYNFHT